MIFFKEIGRGISAYSYALDFIREHRLWHLLIWPALFNFAAFITTLWIAWYYSGIFIDFLREQSGVTESSAFLWHFVQLVLAIIIRLILLLLYLKIYRYIILIFFAPVLSYVSEKVQEILTGRKTVFSVGRLLKDSLRGMSVACRNFLLEIAVTISIIIGGIIVTILAPLVPLMIFLAESYFYGFNMIDYRNEYHGMGLKESNRFIWEHKGLAMANGIVFHFLLLIPVAGVLFAPVLSLIAAILSVDSSDINQKEL